MIKEQRALTINYISVGVDPVVCVDFSLFCDILLPILGVVLDASILTTVSERAFRLNYGEGHGGKELWDGGKAQ